MPKKTKQKEGLIQAIENIKSRFGSDVIMSHTDFKSIKIGHIPTGILSLDLALGIGGIPKGRVTEIFGKESCLVGDTFIPYELRTENGRRQNSKGGTIERLYQRFHKIPIKGSGNYQKKQTINSDFYISSINENDAIVKNKIIDVVYTGKKECFKVETQSGKKLICTKDHKFYIGYGNYLPLSKLSVGSEVYVHDNTPLKGRVPQIRYKEIYVKSHPTAPKKIIEKEYTYFRVKKANAIYEAFMNGLLFDDYIDILNGKKKFKNKIKTIPKGYHIHHKNFIPHDNRLENLELLDGREHNKLHALRNGDKLNFIATTDIIRKIKNVGIKQTYDIKCQCPYNNYIANKFVVHNSGKSTLALMIMAQAQANSETVALVDAEMAFDQKYAKKLGIDTKKLVISQPSNGEEALEIVEELVRSGEVGVIVVDSVAALVPKKEIEGSMGDSQMGLQARMMSQAMRKLTAVIARTNTAVIFLNQIRMKIGVFFGDPETTTGGLALKYYASVRIKLKVGKKIMNGENHIGRVVNVRIMKNKVAPPFKFCTLQLYDDLAGFSIKGDLFLLGQKYNLITKKSNTWYVGENKLGVGSLVATDNIETIKLKALIMDEYEKQPGSQIKTKEIKQKKII